MHPLKFLLDVLAVVRLTKLILHDYLTEPIRDYIFDKYPPANSKLGYLFTCPWCMSIWIGALYFILRRTHPDFTDYLSKLLTASLASGILFEKGIV